MKKINIFDKTVFFLSDKPQKYIRSHLYGYDLLIQPSLFEIFDSAVTESMAEKKMCWCLEPMEIIKSCKYGSYFEKRNPEESMKKNTIISFRANKEMIETAYNRVLQKFDIIVSATCKYYKEYSL